jgi:hypothetical protein
MMPPTDKGANLFPGISGLAVCQARPAGGDVFGRNNTRSQ